MIKVVNKKYYIPYDLTPVYEVYIGRNNGGSVLQNNYFIGRDGTREEAIQKYKIDLREKYNNDTRLRNYLHALAVIARSMTLVLICHCKPLPCHGDVVKECLESIIENGYWK